MTGGPAILSATDKLSARTDTPQEFLNRCRIQFRTVYVISSASDVYHLPEASEDGTLCGLRLAPIIINRPVKTSTLYLTVNEPKNRRLCEACARIDADRKQMRFSRPA